MLVSACACHCMVFTRRSYSHTMMNILTFQDKASNTVRSRNDAFRSCTQDFLEKRITPISGSSSKNHLQAHSVYMHKETWSHSRDPDEDSL